MDGDDPWVFQSGGRARLAVEAVDPRRAPGGVEVIGEAELLEGHLAVELLVVGPPDGPHSALAQQFRQLVPTGQQSSTIVSHTPEPNPTHLIAEQPPAFMWGSTCVPDKAGLISPPP